MRPFHLLTLSLALLLSACGFQLRGTGDYNFAVKQLQFVAEDSKAPLAMELEKQLQARGVKLSDATEYRLLLGREEQTQRTVSFTAGTRSAEHMLTSAVDFEVRTGKLPALVKQRAEVQRAYAFNHNHVSASGEEASMLREEMRKELINQVMLRLQSLTPAQLDNLREHEQAKSDADAAAQREQLRMMQEQRGGSR